MNLKDFVAALQAGWLPALAAFVGCGIIVGGHFYRVPYLESTPELVVQIVAITGVFAFSVLAANIARVPVELWKLFSRWRAARRLKRWIAVQIETAPDDEKTILAYLITSGRSAFTASYNDRRLSPLKAKGLIRAHAGYHDILEWPHSVHEEAWAYLAKNRDRFQFDLSEGDREPLSWEYRRGFR